MNDACCPMLSWQIVISKVYNVNLNARSGISLSIIEGHQCSQTYWKYMLKKWQAGLSITDWDCLPLWFFSLIFWNFALPSRQKQGRHPCSCSPTEQLQGWRPRLLRDFRFSSSIVAQKQRNVLKIVMQKNIFCKSGQSLFLLSAYTLLIIRQCVDRLELLFLAQRKIPWSGWMPGSWDLLYFSLSFGYVFDFDWAFDFDYVFCAEYVFGFEYVLSFDCVPVFV